MTSDLRKTQAAETPLAIDAPWSRPSAEVLAAVGSRMTGLTGEEVDQRVESFGRNLLAPPGRKSWWRRVLGSSTTS